MSGNTAPGRTEEIARKVKRFVRDVVIPYEKDPCAVSHGPTDGLVSELRACR